MFTRISSEPDAKRNLKTLLQAAKELLAETGIDAPEREIAERAGVGVGTLYRHFPQRSDLIEAVFSAGSGCLCRCGMDYRSGT